jgi:hypothetical protein
MADREPIDTFIPGPGTYQTPSDFGIYTRPGSALGYDAGSSRARTPAPMRIGTGRLKTEETGGIHKSVEGTGQEGSTLRSKSHPKLSVAKRALQHMLDTKPTNAE